LDAVPKGVILMTALGKMLKQSVREVRKERKPDKPVWTGPCGDGPQGGVTFSLLSRFLCCRERFRLLVVEGLKSADHFNHRLEFGSMWHVCEEHFAKREDCTFVTDNTSNPLREYSKSLCQMYPTEQDKVDLYYQTCKTMFPLYVEHWSKHPDVKQRTPLLQEQAFDVPYRLPSGRTVRLRGKWDSVDLIGKGKGAGIYLQENKTKGDIDERQIVRQLSFDLQTMLYLVALSEYYEWDEEARFPADAKIVGIRYNVVRRPFSGGKGDIRQGKDETRPALMERLKFKILNAIAEDRDNNGWFMRWKVEISAEDIAKFRWQCLDPILEQLCDWWEWITLGMCFGKKDEDPFSAGPFKPGQTGTGKAGDAKHFRFPYGVWNPLTEGKSSELDGFLGTGSMLGLQRTDQLFPELEV
jgi:hypothetical protein